MKIGFKSCFEIKAKQPQRITTKVECRLCCCFKPHPSCHNGVDISGVTERQRHEVSVQRPDSLEHQPDVAGWREVQQGRGGVFCAGSTIDQRRVDLYRDGQLSPSERFNFQKTEPQEVLKLFSGCIYLLKIYQKQNYILLSSESVF